MICSCILPGESELWKYIRSPRRRLGLNDMVSYQNEEIKNLLKRVATLAGKVIQLEADKAISSYPT